jgi:hypothetical protein
MGDYIVAALAAEIGALVIVVLALGLALGGGAFAVIWWLS